MQISAETKQFLIEHKIDITEAEFKAHHENIHDPFNKITDNHEYIIYTYVENRVNHEKLEQFLLLQNTAESLYMMGYTYDEDIGRSNGRTIKHTHQSIEYYKKSYKMGYVGACYDIARGYCYIKNYAQYFKYISLSADKYCDPTGCYDLGLSYQHGHCGLIIDLRKARHYISLSVNAGHRVQYGSDDLDEIELELLKEFETKLNKDDYVLAYELKKKHNKPGLKDLQKMIEKEYYNVLGQTLSPWGQTLSPWGQTLSPWGQTLSPWGQTLSPWGQTLSPWGQTLSPWGQTLSPWGLLKDLSNIVVSYLL